MDPFGTENKQNKLSLNMSKYSKKSRPSSHEINRISNLQRDAVSHGSSSQESKNSRLEGLEELQLHSGA